MFFSVSSFALITAPYSNSYNFDGTVNYHDKVFINVANKTGSSITKGQILQYDVATYDDAIAVSPIAANDKTTDAACVAAETIANGKIGKCQVYGYSDTILFGGLNATATAGQPIYTGDKHNAGYARAISSGSVATSDIRIGTFFDASSATGSVEGFIKLMN